MTSHDDAFKSFAADRKKDLQRIARATRGEHLFEDVVHEAWLMAMTMVKPDGGVLDLSAPDDQRRLLSHIYQHLVRYTDLNVRHAVRLDHAPAGGEDGDVHPLSHLLVSNDGRDPLGELIEHEAQRDLEAKLDGHGSLAAAYVHLLRQCDNRMPAVAEHLRISVSYAYFRCAHARRLAAHMTHIPIPSVERFAQGAWRRFRLRRPQVQLAFDFEDNLPIW